jgi:hypothetical protein
MIPDARRKYSVDEILANSWDRKLARDLADEIEVCTGDKRETVDEMRRFPNGRCRLPGVAERARRPPHVHDRGFR